jgi:hypothetical protein
MKKILLIVFVIGIMISCAKKNTPQKSINIETPVAKQDDPPPPPPPPPPSKIENVGFKQDVLTIINAKCSPCHIPENGGNKLELNNYETVKKSIDDIIARIKLKPEDRGFMPFRKQPLSEMEVLTLQRWKEQGMPMTSKQ